MKKTHLRLKILLLTGMILAAIATFFGSRIQNELLMRLLLRRSAPSEEVVWNLIENTPQPDKAMWRLWHSNKIPIRGNTLGYINLNLHSNSDLYTQMEPLVVEAARDPDMSARELALGILAAHRSPRLRELALTQLNDADPLVRMLGLQHLKRAEPPSVPTVVPLLEDSELQVAATAATLLRRWTGQNFGVRVGLSVPDGQTGQLPREKEQTLREALDKWKDWWKLHEKDYPAEPVFTQTERETPRDFKVADFALKDLDGRTIHLSDFTGKTVLLNFWATWCTACVMEIPGLIDLQKEFQDSLVILGVSLDGRPDAHGHSHSAQREGESGDENDHHDHSSSEQEDNVKKIQKKVERFVKSKGINYPVVLNSKGDIGARFNGHELPTNVVIDRTGNLRRRFVGKRPLASMKRIIAEVDSPAAASVR